MSWGGDDPHFWPTFLAYGPGRGKVNDWDFTEAVRFWADGKHANRGFMLHGDSHDYNDRSHPRGEGGQGPARRAAGLRAEITGPDMPELPPPPDITEVQRHAIPAGRPQSMVRRGRTA